MPLQKVVFQIHYLYNDKVAANTITYFGKEVELTDISASMPDADQNN